MIHPIWLLLQSKLLCDNSESRKWEPRYSYTVSMVRKPHTNPNPVDRGFLALEANAIPYTHTNQEGAAVCQLILLRP